MEWILHCTGKEYQHLWGIKWCDNFDSIPYVSPCKYLHHITGRRPWINKCPIMAHLLSNIWSLCTNIFCGHMYRFHHQGGKIIYLTKLYNQRNVLEYLIPIKQLLCSLYCGCDADCVRKDYYWRLTSDTLLTSTFKIYFIQLLNFIHHSLDGASTSSNAVKRKIKVLFLSLAIWVS